MKTGYDRKESAGMMVVIGGQEKEKEGKDGSTIFFNLEIIRRLIKEN